MPHARTTILALVVGSILSIGPTARAVGPHDHGPYQGSPQAAVSDDLPPRVVIDAADAAHAAMAEWALERFDAAGLELPPLLVAISGRDQSFCGGVPARAFPQAQPAEVRVCWDDAFILLHELAHIWEAHNLDPERRVGFADLREGVEAWRDRDVPWEARGAEHAANVIAWGLLEDPYPISRTYPNDVASMLEAYRDLTGRDPLHDGGAGIQLPDRSQYQGRANRPLESGR